MATAAGLSLAGGVGRRVADRVRAAARDRVPPARRSVHLSSYDKNLDEEMRPAVLPDNVIDLHSAKYWGPHPKTGVFGPLDQHASAAGSGVHGGSTVLDQAAWFRHQDEVDRSSFA